MYFRKTLHCECDSLIRVFGRWTNSWPREWWRERLCWKEDVATWCKSVKVLISLSFVPPHVHRDVSLIAAELGKFQSRHCRVAHDLISPTILSKLSLYFTLNGVWSLNRTWTRPWLVEMLVRLSLWLRELQSKFYNQHFVRNVVIVITSPEAPSRCHRWSPGRGQWHGRWSAWSSWGDWTANQSSS